MYVFLSYLNIYIILQYETNQYQYMSQMLYAGHSAREIVTLLSDF